MNWDPHVGWRRSDDADLDWWRTDRRDSTFSPSKAVGAEASSQPGSSLAFWTLMVFVSILLIAPQTFWPPLAHFRIALLSGGLAVAACVAERARRRQSIISLTHEMKLIACLSGWAILTIPFSLWPGGSASLLLEVFIKTLVVFWLLGVVVNSPARLRRFVWGLAVMSVPIALTAVKHYLSGSLMQGSADRIVGYEASLTGNPNDLALLLNLFLPLIVALVFMTRRPAIRIMLLVIVLLNLTAVVLTLSRGGFVTLGAIVVAYLGKLGGRPAHKWAIGALAIGLLCFPLLPSTYLNRLATIGNIEGDETGSSQVRWTNTVEAVKLVLQNPVIGSGIGLDNLAINKVVGSTWQHVHNVYLQIAVDLGVPGLILFLLLFVRCLKSARVVRKQCARMRELEDVFYLAEGIEISLLAFAVAGLFHPVAYHFYFYFIGGLASALVRIRANHEQSASAS